jgi:cell division transport system permease protein
VLAVSPEQGLEEFRAATGFGSALALLDDNPLPWVLSVTPVATAEESLAKTVEELTREIEAREGVDSISYDRQWIERLQGLLDLGHAAVNAMIVLFGLAVIVIVSNTIRMDVAARSEEIEVQALVGANNAFIRLPFLYAGLWYGVLGGLVALLLVNAVMLYLEPPLARLLETYGEAAELTGLGLVRTMTVWLLAGVLGLLGAGIAVERRLRDLAVGGRLGRR